MQAEQAGLGGQSSNTSALQGLSASHSPANAAKESSDGALS